MALHKQLRLSQARAARTLKASALAQPMVVGPERGITFQGKISLKANVDQGVYDLTGVGRYG